jgi:uncharacterized protein with PQ loop repeat
MQLRKSDRLAGVRLAFLAFLAFMDKFVLIPTQTKHLGFLTTGIQIAQRETPLALYNGLSAVLSGIILKMSIRFASFEAYKGWLVDKETGQTSVGNIFLCV